MVIGGRAGSAQSSDEQSRPHLPSRPRLAGGLVTHLERSPIDVDLAQWEGYAACLRSAGWETIEVPGAEDCPDAVFVEDAVVMFDDLAVLTNPDAAERRPEVAGLPRPSVALAWSPSGSRVRARSTEMTCSRWAARHTWG